VISGSLEHLFHEKSALRINRADPDKKSVMILKKHIPFHVSLKNEF